MSTTKIWNWLETRGDVRVAFFGRQAAASAADLAPRLSPQPDAMSWLHQMHSARVHQARPGLTGDGDGLVSIEPRLALTVATADCVPVLMASRRRIAAVHAGWRGLVSGVLQAALERFGPAAAETDVWIGPAIGPCCYEIGDDVGDRLRAVATDTALSEGPSGRCHADLQAIARYQLRAVRRIEQIDLCTRCGGDFLASYRRDGDTAGRNWGVIWRV